MTNTVEQTTKKMESQVPVNTSISTTEHLTTELWGQQLALANEFVKSQLCPLKKPEDVVVVLNTARELGITPTVALNGIHVINGKFTLGVHIIVGLLLKNKITFTILEDFDYIKVKKANSEETEVARIGNLNVYDRKTTIRFKRKIKYDDGTYEDMFIDFTIRLSEMFTLGLHERDQWVKQPRTMLRTRCLSMGARLIAADILGGMHEYTEMLDAANIDYSIDKDDAYANVTILDEDVQSASPN